MAELSLKVANSTTQFGCYSERGLMSYFMFVVLPTQLGDFLADLQFPEGVTNPFASTKGTHPNGIIFSELDFGKEGFGCPDGAIFVDFPKPMMVFIECKANENYTRSCGGTKKKYNSKIQGQLELRWRMTHLHRTKCHQTYGGIRYIQETPELKKIYESEDVAFYGHAKRQDEARRGSWRRLQIDQGVKKLLDYLERCEDRVYFCAITADTQNPFDSVDAKLLPRCGNADWSASKRHFCWLPVTRIKVVEVATNV